VVNFHKKFKNSPLVFLSKLKSKNGFAAENVFIIFNQNKKSVWNFLCRK